MSSSPWANIVKVDAEDLQNIMSEEYARVLQQKEDEKFVEQQQQLITANKQQQQENKLPANLEVGGFTDVDGAGGYDDDGGNSEVMLSKTTEGHVFEDPLDDNCDNDRLIAEMLQDQLNREYDLELQRIERAQNKGSKVTISLEKFRLCPGDLLKDSSEDEQELDDNPRKHWDRFETNEKIFENIPKKGFGYDEDGLMVTKHDDRLNGVRNACRVMSFPPEIHTGDAAGFDMKLPNAVFNQLKTYSQKAKKTSKAHDRRENEATAEMGVDNKTRLLLYKLVNNEILQQVNGIISTGKEAIILHATADPNYSGDLKMPKECAIKVFKITLNEFKQRDRYIKDDYRFKDRFSKQNNRVIINMWAEKEMHNLQRMRKCGINCPEVIILKKHVLVMSFIGEGNVAAPKLKHAALETHVMREVYDEVVIMMRKMYHGAKLVHADLSEYNILWHDHKVWFIDVAQSVEPSHPSALEFLMRDCNNISTFFSRCGVEAHTKEELFSHISGLDASAHNAAMLERIHVKGPSMSVATSPSSDRMPETMKPLPFPFDYAWEKSIAAAAAAPEEVVVGAN